METISRSLQQRKRLEVFSRVRWEAMTLVEASILLRLSYRQTKRVWCQYQASGCEGLLHRVRGRLSNRQWRVAACQAVHAWLDMASTERSVSPTSEDVLEGERPMTQVGRKISALDVELILALSSQVKGRVERRNGTLQNRLVKAIRRAGILGIGSANRFLDEQFLPELNGRFTVSGRASESHHRAVTAAWLDRHGFKYHGIVFGKPRGGNYHWIDNHIVRATRYNGRFTDLVKKEATIEVFQEDRPNTGP